MKEKEKMPWEIKQEKEAKDLVSQIENHISDRPLHKLLIGYLSQMHRTHQQSFTMLCVSWFKHLADVGHKGYGWYDGRNEASVMLGLDLEPILKEKGYLPFI